jgi:glycosyltransferase involved in cell wall biosynthesis
MTKSKIHVVHLITGLRSGGAENMLLRLLKNIDKSRFECTVISLSEKGALAPEFNALGVKVHILGIRSFVSTGTGLVRLFRILRAHPFDALQTWLYHADFLGLLVKLFNKKTKLIWNIRCSEVRSKDVPFTTLFLIRVLRLFSSVPDIVIVNSTAGLEFHKRLGYRPAEWRMIYNGFDLSRFALDSQAKKQKRLELGISVKSPVIGFVARYDPIKDFPNFFSAMEIVVQSIPSVRIVMAGERLSHRNDELVGYCRAVNLMDNVILLGECNDIPRVLAAMDVLVSSSRSEGFPNVIGEAMASSVPCVATAVGDTEALIVDFGRIVPPRSPECDRKALGQKARMHIEKRFSIASCVMEYEQTYQMVSRGKAS